jgi:CMP-N,N'-diacetyllegionaminic acid synthase
MPRQPANLDAIAIVLARAGSKGVPGKNSAVIGGRPCIEWTLDAAAHAKRVAFTLVSTDGEHLAKIAGRRGALVIDRPKNLAGDRATVDAAARHALTTFERQMQCQFPPRQPIVILYANVPIRPEGLIDSAVTLLQDSRAHSVQSYAPVGKFHPWWTARVNARTGRVTPWEGKVLNHGVFRRQDLPAAHIPDGGVLAVTRQALMLEIKGVPAGPHRFFGKDRRGIINPEGCVIDIDSPIDLIVADAMLQQRA